jgi:hypothetical protein
MLKGRTPNYTSYRLPMRMEDSYVMSKIFSILYTKVSYPWCHSASIDIRHNESQSLMINISTQCLYAKPTGCSYGNKFPYTTKELLAYLYDKIESN